MSAPIEEQPASVNQRLSGQSQFTRTLGMEGTSFRGEHHACNHLIRIKHGNFHLGEGKCFGSPTASSHIISYDARRMILPWVRVLTAIEISSVIKAECIRAKACRPLNLIGSNEGARLSLCEQRHLRQPRLILAPPAEGS